MEPVEDLRVVRGPDWEHGDEDGGEGHLGTVVEIHHALQSEEASASVESGLQNTESSNDGNQHSVPASEGEVKSVTVQWDCGHRGVYKCGMDGKFELRVFDTAQAGLHIIIHARSLDYNMHRPLSMILLGVRSRSVTCDGCRVTPLLGIRWKCSQCYDYDLCTTCYMSNKHSEGHRFVRYDKEQLRYIP